MHKSVPLEQPRLIESQITLIQQGAGSAVWTM